ncbi:MAG: winged helix-turn-helix domain-containing protein [Candidatus Hadarchaeum sp.]
MKEVNSDRKRRNIITLYVDILNAIGTCSRKSHIVYRANLNFNRCQKYLDELLRMGLIKIEKTHPIKWSVTEKGNEFLKKYNEIQNLLQL